MKDALNNGLIKAMREHLPEETNLAKPFIAGCVGRFRLHFMKYHYCLRVWGFPWTRSLGPTGRKEPFLI